MKYHPEGPMVTYQSKYEKKVAEFGPLEWMVAFISHIPDRGAQIIHYYGQYSNATRGRLKKEDSQPEYCIGFSSLFHGCEKDNDCKKENDFKKRRKIFIFLFFFFNFDPCLLK